MRIITMRSQIREEIARIRLFHRNPQKHFRLSDEQAAEYRAKRVAWLAKVDAIGVNAITVGQVFDICGVRVMNNCDACGQSSCNVVVKFGQADYPESAVCSDCLLAALEMVKENKRP